MHLHPSAAATPNVCIWAPGVGGSTFDLSHDSVRLHRFNFCAHRSHLVGASTSTSVAL